MDYLEILKQYWGYDSFRGIQHDIITSIGSGHDTLGLMPTGGGKSVTFQVPALAMEGVCLVITPLIALMKDQVAHLRGHDIVAEAIYSSMSRAEIVRVLENCILGHVKFLYVSPERLSSDIFLKKLRHINVSFVTVDEAHCISQWGYDFRPAYLRIAAIRQMLPGKPVLALTATATPEVADDIQRQLHFQEPRVYRMSFERKNLAYVVRNDDDKESQLLHILRSVAGSAIVYVRTRRQTRVYAQLLEENGVSATSYHAGLEPAVKDQRQRQWTSGEKRVVVATNAFGMGIDKPDVRLVVHVECPDSIEAYFQEAGRAGRDGQKAYAVLLWSHGDVNKLKRRVDGNYPKQEFIRNVYDHLAFYYTIGVGSGAGHTFSFDIDKFSYTYNFFPTHVHAALKLLSNAGYIEYDCEPESSARVMFLLSRNELYKLDRTTPQEEAVVTSLLRCYGGLFADYQYIDEALVALQANMGREACYQVLKSLSQRRIIHFIPQRKTPLITYPRDRVEGEKVVLPASVYEARKEQFIKRLSAMMAYATTDGICRSQQLLRYFGEKRMEDCGICDVCQGARHSPESQEKARRLIMELLADGQRHHVSELKNLPCPTDRLDEAVRYLAGEEKIHLDGAMVYS